MVSGKKLGLIMVLLTLLSIVIFSTTGQKSSAEQPLHKIVIFKQGVDVDASLEAVKIAGGTVKKTLLIINGQAITLPSKAAEKALAKNPQVFRIDDDIQVTATKPPASKESTPSQPLQMLPWGIDKIDAEIAWSVTTGQGVKVAIIDTGIDTNHPDLQGNIKGGINTISSRKSYQDDNGHGTHVAGTIAAIDNTIGVAGTAPKAHIYAVKALDRNGSGYLSDIIEGLQWSVNNEMQVVNLSLGTNSNIQSLHDAIKAAYDAGVILVAAAGNDGPYSNSVDYPARYPETMAVSAIDNQDQIAGWSSRGPEVDLAAPGVSVLSTWNDDYYKNISGTSMATPHVTGTVALALSVHGPMAPAAMKNHLKATAEDLGLATELQGAGLVDAQAAVQ